MSQQLLAAKKKGSKDLFASFFTRVPGNADKLLRNSAKKRDNANQADDERMKKIQKNVADYAKQLFVDTAPMMREKEIEDADIRANVKDVLEHLVYGVTVKLAAHQNSLPTDLTTESDVNLAATDNSSDASLGSDAAVTNADNRPSSSVSVGSSSPSPAVKGKSRPIMMVAAELNSSSLVAPFIVFDGTKKKNAKNLTQTSWWKYRNWKTDAPGRTATITFHHKHWFDEDITIEYLEHLLNLHPGKKIGLIWDACKAHSTPLVQAFIEEHSDRIVCVGITGGLTSVIQVCDLVANKDIKQFIRNRYYMWRTEFIRAERSKLIQAGTPDERIKLKIPRDVMINVVEEAFKEFNRRELERESIRKTFRKVSQDPWRDSSAEFKAHLDSLAEEAMYKALFDNQAVNDIDSNPTVAV